MSARGWSKTTVNTRPDLFRAVYDWNHYPHRWARQDRLADAALPLPVVQLLERTPAGRERLSRHFCSSLGLVGGFWSFEEPWRRLVLLSAGTLQLLARRIGAGWHASRIARVVTRLERQQVIAAIGEPTYAQLLRQRTADARPTWLPPVTSSLVQDLESTGWSTLARALGHWPDDGWRRFLLKVPLNQSPIRLPATDPEEAVTRDVVMRWLPGVLKPEEAKCLS